MLVRSSAGSEERTAAQHSVSDRAFSRRGSLLGVHRPQLCGGEGPVCRRPVRDYEQHLDWRPQAMSRDRWATVERLYHAALARPVEERAAYLAEACAGDAELRREVESLLVRDASDLLTRGAVVAAAGLVSDVGRSALTGHRLGSYQVLAPLGAGGMGDVYRARDTRLGRDVAIKILPSAFTSHPD